MTIDISCKKGIVIICLAIFIVGSVIFSNRVFSYNDDITHPALTDNVAKIYNANFDRKLSNEEVEWLKQGSVKEDLAPRWLNHFYNPENGLGLGSMMNSKDWAQSPNYQALSNFTFSGGNQTWQKAIESYAQGKNQEAFFALGHVLHLLEDATVPAHTRLDAHPEGDPYENYVVNQVYNINFNVPPNLLNTISVAFDNLANYSGSNFLSKDTVNKNILKNEAILFKEYEGKTYRCIQGLNESCLILVKRELAGDVYYFDNLVHSDYFFLLAPKAISYGAGAVKLFFDEAEKAKQEYENKSWWQKLKDSANQLLSGFSGMSLSAGIGTDMAPRSAQPSEAPEVLPSATPTPSAVSLPPNAVAAREKIVAQLPIDTVEVQEKSGGDIIEEVVPEDSEIPPAIAEETIPSQAKLPSPSPLVFVSGGGSQSSPLPSPSPTATSTATSTPDIIVSETTINVKPESVSSSTTAIFEFSSSANNPTFSCQLDNATSTDCSSPQEYTNLIEGGHLFEVIATDAAGNQDIAPAQYSWSIDFSAPQLNDVASTPGRNSALISWASSEMGIFQVEYGTSTDYGFLSATTSASNLTLDSLLTDKDYHFRILAQDNLGNSTTTADNFFTTTASAENVIISEIQISGATARDEFVELYNPTSADINLSGWKLAHRLSSATSSYGNLLTSFPDKTIPAKGYFLIAHPTDYDGGVPADAVYSSAGYSITDNNAIILYSDAGHTLVDLVGLGTASSSETAATINPSDNQSVERKAFNNSTATSMFSGTDKWQGNNYDVNDNSRDFVLQENPAPQNSLMLTEPRIVVPNLMITSSWPAWQGNLARTGQSLANSLATSTMAVKWTATTTLNDIFVSRPSLDDQGNIYIGKNDGLAKFSPSGDLLWISASSTSYTAPLILSDGSVLVRGSWSFSSFTSGGQLKWKFPLDGTAGSNAHPAILSDGTILTQSDRKIYALNQDATLKWIFDPIRPLKDSVAITALVVDSLDNIYVAIDDYIYALDKTGVKIWEKNIGNKYSSLALSQDNILYVSTSGVWPEGGGFYALDKNSGATLWVDEPGSSSNGKAHLAPVVDGGGHVYQSMFYSNGDKKLHMYSSSSTPSWSADLASIDLAAPILTSDGKIYVADQDALKIFDAANGNLIFEIDFPRYSNIYMYFGAIAVDGTIYTTGGNSNGGTLYAIGAEL